MKDSDATTAQQPMRRALEDECCWVSLLLHHPDGRQLVLVLEGQVLVVGRGRHADVAIDAADISRRHARLELEGDGLWVEDLNSTHGTSINGKRIARAVAGRGDEISFGGIVAVVYSDSASLMAPTKATGVSVAATTIIRSPLMRQLYDTIHKVAGSVIPVLIHGETGCGKELVAQALHDGSPRRSSPLLSVNCAAIPADLMESVLFGHERGAFTGAHEQKRGLFEQADKGTLFLDEIGELPPKVQAALLRVLETKRVTRVGASQEKAVDVRIIAATHQDLELMCESGTFRRDLLYRLNTMVLEVPPLRQRGEEIAALARYFLEEANAANGYAVKGIESGVLELLRRYGWPGNVRELRNTIERAVVLAGRGLIAPEHLPQQLLENEGEHGDQRASLEALALDPIPGDPIGLDFKTRIQRFEAALIEEALRGHGANRIEAARALGMPERSLRRKVRAYHLEE